ncbi:MAG: PTS sugar transporter subunit IIA [Kiritimatiellia bacterium]
MNIQDVISPERILFLDNETRTGAIKKLVPLLAGVPGMPDEDDLEVAFLQREEMMSTGIGMGIGVPHVRLQEIDSLVMAVSVCADGIADYPSIDNEPVKIVAMIAAGASQHGEYIKMLARVVSVLKSEETRNAILNSESADEVYALLCQDN